MNESLLSVLQEYGLNEKESMIYLVTLELWKAPASTVARQVGLKRVTVYAIMQDMVRKGVLMELKTKWVKQFSVIDPQKLHAQRAMKCGSFESRLPEFAAMADARSNKPKIQYFEWSVGILKIYDDMLTSKTPISAFVGVDAVDPTMKKILNEVRVYKRIERGIRANVISSPTVMWKEYQWLDEEHLRETRMIDDDAFWLGSEIDMYGPNRVSFILYSGEEMTWVVIHSENLYNTLMGIFRYLWKVAE